MNIESTRFVLYAGTLGENQITFRCAYCKGSETGISRHIFYSARPGFPTSDALATTRDEAVSDKHSGISERRKPPLSVLMASAAGNSEHGAL